jgi:hypothetical protein
MVRDGHIDTGDPLGHRLGAAVQLAEAELRKKKTFTFRSKSSSPCALFRDTSSALQKKD